MPRLRRDAVARMNHGAAANSYWDENNEWSPFTAPGGSLFAPADAAYVVREPHADLYNERVILSDGTITHTDDTVRDPHTIIFHATAASAPRTIGLTLDGGGTPITTGEKGYVTVPFSGTITGWTLLADQVGSIVIDVWSDTYGNFPPTVADTIAGSEKPTLSGAQKAQDASLTTWDTAVVAGDVIAFNVDSASTVRRVTLTLTVTPS